jgi:6-phosphogluconolactonase
VGAPAEVRVVPTEADLTEDVTARLVATLAHAQHERGAASLVLTGGGIMEKVLGAVGGAAGHDAVEWGKVDVYWGDERFVPSDSPDRNDLPARRLMLDRLPFDPVRIHPMAGSDGPHSDPEDAAAGYARLLDAAARRDQGGHVPHFDIVLLGIGPDGHCCSLFPEQPGVYEMEAYVIAVRNSPKPPPIRISLTFPALDQAEQIWFVASGETKADAVAMALSGAGRVQVPAAGPHGRSRTLWLLDEAAAGRLPPSLHPPAIS